jgi:hypothetical protein
VHIDNTREHAQMVITPEQHYDLTWIFAIVAVLLVLVLSDWVHNWWVKRQANKLQAENSRLTRYSHMRIQ